MSIAWQIPGVILREREGALAGATAATAWVCCAPQTTEEAGERGALSCNLVSTAGAGFAVSASPAAARCLIRDLQTWRPKATATRPQQTKAARTRTTSFAIDQEMPADFCLVGSCVGLVVGAGDGGHGVSQARTHESVAPHHE